MIVTNFDGMTNIGNYRQNNEDYFNFSFNSEGNFVAVLCDGMGGHSYGEVASKLACDYFINAFQNSLFNNLNDKQVNDWIRKTIDEIKKEMCKIVSQDEKKADMGTTFVASLVLNQKIFVVNIGDSRFYKIHKTKLYQITTDQNLMNTTDEVQRQEMEFQGLYKRKYNENVFWNILTSALGPDKKMNIDIFVIEDIIGKYILTTDGIHDYVSEDDFIDVFESHNLVTDKIKILINRALDNLSTDNLTAISFEIR